MLSTFKGEVLVFGTYQRFWCRSQVFIEGQRKDSVHILGGEVQVLVDFQDGAVVTTGTERQRARRNGGGPVVGVGGGCLFAK